jgi:hypothetical protein
VRNSYTQALEFGVTAPALDLAFDIVLTGCAFEAGRARVTVS